MAHTDSLYLAYGEAVKQLKSVQDMDDMAKINSFHKAQEWYSQLGTARANKAKPKAKKVLLNPFSRFFSLLIFFFFQKAEPKSKEVVESGSDYSSEDEIKEIDQDTVVSIRYPIFSFFYFLEFNLIIYHD